jgi:solute:Na+ symporter, SSS family
MNLSIYDCIVIGFYLVFMFSLGPVYKSFSKTSSDYFRGGGTMIWWVVGSSAFMTGFSAWSFVGGAGKMYETGTFIFVLFAANIIAMIFMFFFTAARYRQMRIVTAVEAVRDRFGKTNEQVFTWLLIPTILLWSGMGLYTIAVFMSGVFDLSMEFTIIALAVTVIGMTIIGGSWAATAGDFIQMLIVVCITALMAFLVVTHPEIGGLRGLIEKMPSHHFSWTEFDRPGVLLFYIITLSFNQLMVMNSIAIGAAKYVFVKNGKDAKKAVLLSIVGSVFLTPILLIPPVAATIFFPDMQTGYGNLNNPNEAAYVAMAIKFLPPGLLGMMICAVFAASLTSMNSGLNSIAGTFVRNFYIEVVNKNASDKKQILAGRLFILLFGIAIVATALFFKNIKGLDLFDLTIIIAASVNMPLAIPTFLGIFIKRTPSWAGWGTMVIGLAAAIFARIVFTPELIEKTVDYMFVLSVPLNARELGDINVAATTALVLIVCNGFFFLSMLFYNPKPQEKKRVEEFFERMNTPIDIEKEHGPERESDGKQLSVLSNMCLIYGGFILLMLLIPNDLASRLQIAALGLFIMALGKILSVAARARKNDV